MVTKVMPVSYVDLTNRDPRSTTDGTRKKQQQNTSFKEVFAKELASISKR